MNAMLAQCFVFVPELLVGPGSRPTSLFYLKGPGAMLNSFSPRKDAVSLPGVF